MRVHSPLKFFSHNRKERLVLNSLEYATSIPKNYKPAKGSLLSSQVFVTSPRTFGLLQIGCKLKK